jgi:DNA-binding MarR family transcriptional regulator
MQTDDPFVATLQEWVKVFMRRSMRNFFIYSKESGLSMPQIGALFHIYNGPSGVSDLGDDLGVTSGAASQMLERLVQFQLILRSEDPHDRRFKHLVLTEKGRRTLDESIHAREGWLEELANNLSADEKEQVTAALRVLIEKSKLFEEKSE